MHECPECGQACYCNGDVEDMFNQEWDNYVNCKHYREAGCEFNQHEEEDDEPEFIPHTDGGQQI